ncbi:hypothetical protein GCM10009019_25480 [Salarchaeum japonicum]|uniref:Uncharacterized protein n=1 Tax=Salarchaeum japonicum TaxID=555573 RepID=A0AAV3T3S7_9EURY
MALAREHGKAVHVFRGRAGRDGCGDGRRDEEGGEREEGASRHGCAYDAHDIGFSVGGVEPCGF